MDGALSGCMESAVANLKEVAVMQHAGREWALGCGVSLLYAASVMMLMAAYVVNIENDPWNNDKAFPGIHDNSGAIVAFVLSAVAVCCASIRFALTRRLRISLVTYLFIVGVAIHRILSLVPQL